jgi:hypothetical protein
LALGKNRVTGVSKFRRLKTVCQGVRLIFLEFLGGSLLTCRKKVIIEGLKDRPKERGS